MQSSVKWNRKGNRKEKQANGECVLFTFKNNSQVFRDLLENTSHARAVIHCSQLERFYKILAPSDWVVTMICVQRYLRKWKSRRLWITAKARSTSARNGELLSVYSGFFYIYASYVPSLLLKPTCGQSIVVSGSVTFFTS